MKTYLFKSTISVQSVIASFFLLSCGIESHVTITSSSNDANSSDNNHSSMQVIKRTLENGLTVYLSPNHEEPRFYAEIITRAGSKHDPATNTGLAHYLEHLLFKGTSSFGTVDYENEKVLLDEITELYEKRSRETNQTKRKEIYEQINEVSARAASLAIPNEMDRVYSDMGGKGINAHTWHEETVYKVDLPGNRLDTGENRERTIRKPRFQAVSYRIGNRVRGKEPFHR